MYAKIKLIFFLLDKKSKLKVSFFAIGRVLLGLLDLVGVLLIGLLLAKTVNGISLTQNSSATSSFTIMNSFANYSIVQIALIASGAFILKSILSAIFTRYMYKTLALTEAKMATNTFSYLINNMSWTIKRYSKSDLNYLLSGSIMATIQILTSAVSIVSDLFFLVIILFSFALVSIETTLFVLIYFGVIAFTLHTFLGKRFENSGRISLNAGIVVTTLIFDTVQSFREVISLNREKFFLDKFRNKKFEGSEASFYVQFLNTLPRYIIESALVIGALGIIYFSYEPNNPQQSAETIGIFLTGATRIISSLLPLQTTFANYRNLSALSEKFIELENLTNANKPPRNFSSEVEDLKKNNDPIGVKISKMSFTYDGGLTYAIKNIDLNIEPGKFVAIIGPSGSGKSTLADILIGINNPTSGVVTYYSEKSSNLPKKAFRFGYVSQNPGKVYGTVKDNIAFGEDEENIEKESLDRAIEISHLTDLMFSLEDGIETHLGEQTDSLSGGQMQRIGLARALYVRPNLLVLDEATSALDVETESAITDSLNKLHGECTIVVIAHRLTTVQNADVVYVLNEGELVSSGKFSELASKNEMVAKFVELSDLKTN